jgi:hypothetical protein
MQQGERAHLHASFMTEDAPPTDPNDIVMRVITELAAERGREATELTPLAHTIDPDGLRRVVDSATVCTLSFYHAKCDVEIQVAAGKATVRVEQTAK